MERYLTATEAAEKLGLTRQAIYMRVHRGTIPFVKWGRVVRFDPRRLEQMMQAHAQDVLTCQ